MSTEIDKMAKLGTLGTTQLDRLDSVSNDDFPAEVLGYQSATYCKKFYLGEPPQ